MNKMKDIDYCISLGAMIPFDYKERDFTASIIQKQQKHKNKGR